MPAESFEGAQTVWLNAAGRTVRRPPVARSIRCRIIRASQAAFGRSACGESRIPVPKLRPTDAPKNRTVRGKRDGCRNGPSPCGPCYRDAAPPLVRNCTGDTSSALLSQQAHDTGPADRSGMTKRSPPRSSGHSVWSIRATSGPASGAGRTSGRAAYSETVAGVRLQGSLSAMHAGTCRDIGADPG